MTSKREASKSYRERTARGGVYLITNTLNGRYLIGHATDIASVTNRFQFAVTMGSAVDPRMRDDWQALGASAFMLTILEELDQQPNQSRAAFLDDLAALEGMLCADRDASQSY
ncbi:MAG TPA: GIY-YIG nuclease family protein [Ktedonobacterales bacterium]|nr:GIY-YIG nuclease family protein [Ktedonobacterales bacterium]